MSNTENNALGLGLTVPAQEYKGRYFSILGVSLSCLALVAQETRVYILTLHILAPPSMACLRASLVVHHPDTKFASSVHLRHRSTSLGPAACL